MALAAEFRSIFGLHESVARLQDATCRIGQSEKPANAAVGTVTGPRVQLQRVSRNSYKALLVPFFIGRFEQRPDGVYLVGRFLMPWYSKVITAVWVGVWLAVAVRRISFSGHTSIAMLLASPALIPVLALILSIIWIARGLWRSHDDVAWLRNRIATALQETPVHADRAGHDRGAAP